MVNSQAPKDRADTVSYEVVERIADVEDVDPLALTPSLYDVINPDALESVFDAERALGKVVFNYRGYEVSVFSDGHVAVEAHGA